MESCLIGQCRTCGYQTDSCQSSGFNCVQSVFHSDRNLYVTQSDSVFIYGLSYGPMPVLFSIHCPLWLLTAEPWQRAHSSEVKPKARASKAHMASGGHGRRLLSGRAGRGQKEWTVTRSLLNISTRRPGRVFEVESYRGELHRWAALYPRFYQIRWWQEER